MKTFNYLQTTDIHFGAGRVNEIGEVALKFGKRCLLVTTPPIPVLKPMFERVKKLLFEAGLEVAHFDQVQANPTTDTISAGAKMAEDHGAEMIIGLGGGSSMDSAKAIAVEASHEGTSWDYLFYRDTQPTDKTLPIIAITTTSGTGSQVTQVAVVTNTKERDKSALYNSIIFPDVSIIDPELMLTLPKQITAATGFDVFCHAFESTLHPNASDYTNLLAWEAIKTVAANLPIVLSDLTNIEARSKMAYADTLAGLCIASAGVTLPHGIGMAIGGMYPHVAHGEALAIIYPAFSRFTYKSAIAQFAKVGRIFNPNLNNAGDNEAAAGACKAIDEFIERIGMSERLKDVKMPEEEIPALAKQSMVLPDYKGNPRVATEDEMLELIKQAYYGI
ncbi:iron-containing alcohol dehydrogenase [bacterium]|nr:iron-containing alcohol dehydrogenase [bacterium]